MDSYLFVPSFEVVLQPAAAAGSPASKKEPQFPTKQKRRHAWLRMESTIESALRGRKGEATEPETESLTANPCERKHRQI